MALNRLFNCFDAKRRVSISIPATPTLAVKDVDRLAEPAGRVRFLSDDERVELLKACNHSGNSDLYTIALCWRSRPVRAVAS